MLEYSTILTSPSKTPGTIQLLLVVIETFQQNTDVPQFKGRVVCSSDYNTILTSPKIIIVFDFRFYKSHGFIERARKRYQLLESLRSVSKAIDV